MIINRKRNIYIGVIVFCAVTTFLVFTFAKPSLPEVKLPITNQSNIVPQSQSKQSGSASIQVFPSNREFNTLLFEVAKFKALKEYQPLTIDTEKELGRNNPFASY